MGSTKLLTVLALSFAGYVCFVALLEVAIWRFQPEMPGQVILTTTDREGKESSRTLAGFEHKSRLYVSSNHWLRGWYRAALSNPDVEITVDGETKPYRATRVQGSERDELSAAYTMGFVLRFICGFAPSRFLLLEPRQAPAA